MDFKKKPIKERIAFLHWQVNEIIGDYDKKQIEGEDALRLIKELVADLI